MNFLDSRLPDRFWSKCMPDPMGGCWLWFAAQNLQGYGRMQWPPAGTFVLAHRLAYENLIGPITVGLDLDHLCRVRCCVNPQHLEPVSHRENMLRGDTVIARQVRRIALTGTCIHGHDYATNSLTRKNGKRECRTCARLRKIARAA